MTQDVKVNGFSVLLFRIALSIIFIFAGVAHLVHPDKVAARINKAAFHGFAVFFGDAYLLGLLSGYALLLFGLTFMLGIYTRYSAIILILILIPITITIQMGNGLLHGPLWKNVALFGGLLFFIINNPSYYSLRNSSKKYYNHEKVNHTAVTGNSVTSANKANSPGLICYAGRKFN